jgi:hypothetical protein
MALATRMRDCVLPDEVVNAVNRALADWVTAVDQDRAAAGGVLPVQGQPGRREQAVLLRQLRDGYWSRLVAADQTSVLPDVLLGIHKAVQQSQQLVKPVNTRKLTIDLLEQQLEAVPTLLREQNLLKMLQRVDELVNHEVNTWLTVVKDAAAPPAPAAATAAAAAGEVNASDQVDRLVGALTSSGLTYSPGGLVQGEDAEQQLHSLGGMEMILGLFKKEGTTVMVCLQMLEALHAVVQYIADVTESTGEQQQRQMQLGHWQLLLLCGAYYLQHRLLAYLPGVLQALEVTQVSSPGDSAGDNMAQMLAKLVPAIIRHLKRVEVEVGAVLANRAARSAAEEGLALLQDPQQQQVAWQQVEAVLSRVEVGGCLDFEAGNLKQGVTAVASVHAAVRSPFLELEKLSSLNCNVLESWHASKRQVPMPLKCYRCTAHLLS